MTDYRWQAADALLDKIAAHTSLAGVQVEPGDPGEDQQADSIWLDQFTNEGDVDVPHFAGSPVSLIDTWILPINVVTIEGPTLTACATRLGELVAPVIEVIRDNPGLPEAESTGVLVDSLVLVRRTDSVGRTPQGPAGVCRLEVEIRSRVTG